MRSGVQQIAGVMLALLIAVGAGSCGRNRSTIDDIPVSSYWGIPSIHASKPGVVSYSKTVTDSNANSTLFFVTTGGGQLGHVWAQRYDAKRRTWGGAIQLDNNDLENIYFLTLDAAVDSDGNVVVMWIADEQMRVSRYVAARDRWDTATAIRDLPVSYFDVKDEQLTVDDAGNAAVVWWEEQVSGGKQLWVASLTSSGSWTTQFIASSDSPYSEHFEVRFDSTGNATLTWIQETNYVNSLWAAQRASNGMWETPKLLSVQNAGSVFEFKSAVDLLGNTTWVWRQHTGVGDLAEESNARLWSARITAGMKLGETTISAIPVDLDLSTHDIWRTWDLVGSGTGKFTLIWNEAETGSDSKIWSRTLVADSNWSVPVAIETIDNFHVLSHLRVAVDSAGRVTTVWRLSRNSISDLIDTYYANRTNNEGVWGAPVKITNVARNPNESVYLIDLRLDQYDNLYATLMIWGTGFGSGDQFRVARIGAQQLFDGAPLEAVTLGERVQYSPQFTFGESGAAIVSWIKYDDNATHLNGGVSARSVSADGVWSSVANLEEGNEIGSLPPLVVQDKMGVATLVWSSVSISGEARMRSARLSGGEWTAGPDATPPTDETNIRNRAENLWLDADGIPALTVGTDEVENGRSTLWSVRYPTSEK